MAKKFPVYKQLDSADCGPTCLRMISKYYGQNVDLQNLRDFCSLNRYGVSMLGLNDAAEHIGFRSMGVKTSFDRLAKDVIFPCIVHWRDDHFIVVYKIKVRKKGKELKGKVYATDPAFGLVCYSVEEFLDGWITDTVDGKDKGYVLQMVPTMLFFNPEYKENEKVKLTVFLQYFTPYKKFFFQVILGMIVGLAFSFVMPFLTQSVVDVGILNNNINFIYMVMVAQLIIAFSELFIGFIRSWIMLHVMSRIGIALISDFITKMLRLPISFFDSKKTGDLMQRIGDHSRIQSFFTGTAIGTAFSFVTFFVFAIVLWFYNQKMLLIFLVGHVLYVTWVFLFLKIRRELDYKHFDQAARNQSSIVEILTGAQEIKLSGCESKMRNKWESIQANLLKIKMKGLTIGQIQSGGSFFLSNVTNIIISVYSAQLVIGGEITLGMMMSLSYIIGQLKGPIGAFIGFVHSFQDAKISLERLSEVHFKQDEIQENESKYKYFLSDEKDIHLNHVTYSYYSRNSIPVLKDVSFTIPQNKVTAIVGESGSGKTTLLKLLLGYYEPSGGAIHVGKIKLDNFDKTFWRSRCGTVMQDGFIFSMTIAENIAVSSEFIDRKRLYDAAVLANIHGFIEQLPAGYNTKIGPEGGGISQGQKQRIQIARAVYKDPEFIFFDEATNSLDAINEKIIVENLQKFYRGRTAVIVAHRLSTVKNADQIVVLDNGAVVEVGTHDNLIAQKGCYYHLVKNQITI